MKKIIFSLFLISLTTLAFASSDEGGKEVVGFPGPGHTVSDKVIYDGLRVDEKNVTGDNMGASTFLKEIGGLVCQKITVFTGSPTKPGYICSLNEEFDANLIYRKLAVKEENETPDGLVGSATFGKLVGRLHCQRQAPVVPHPKWAYRCELAKP